MKLNTQIALIVVAVIVVGGASALSTFADRNQNQSKGVEAAKKAFNGQVAKQLDDEMTPTVQYEAESSDAAKISANRQLRNSKHDNARWVRHDLDPRVSEVVDESEWTLGLSDLPVNKSDLILEGQVINAEGFLSNDLTGVYSEFSVQVTGILKNSTGEAINPNDTVITERVGGKVKYKSGRIIRYRIQGQGSPIRGEMYLFFLNKSQQGAYRLLTAYQIQGAKIFALDGSRINVRGQGDWVFDKHNGEDLEGFMKKVQEAIKKSQ